MPGYFIVVLKLYHFCGGVRYQAKNENLSSISRKVKNTYMWFSNIYKCKSNLYTGLCPVEVLILVCRPVICLDYTSLYLLLI